MSEEHEPIEEEATEDDAEPDALNAADPRSVERASRRAKVWLAQRREFWRTALSTEIGRRAIWEFLTIECNFGNVPVANSPSGFPDAAGTMLWIGVYRVGERLYKILDLAAPDLVREMRVENDPEYQEARASGSTRRR